MTGDKLVNAFVMHSHSWMARIGLYYVLLMFSCWGVGEASDVSTATAAFRESRKLSIDSKELQRLAESLTTKGGKAQRLVGMYIRAKADLDATHIKDPGLVQQKRDEWSTSISNFIESSFSEFATELEDDATLVCEGAKWLGVHRRFDRATQIIDEMGHRVEQRERVPLAITLSQLRAAQNEWKEALRLSAMAVNTANSLYEGGNEAEVRSLRKEADANHIRLTRLQDIALHGLGFRLYYEANILRLQMTDFGKAQRKYEELLLLGKNGTDTKLTTPLVWAFDDEVMSLPIHPIYSAAATFGILASMQGQGKIDLSNPLVRQTVKEIDSPFYPANALIIADELIASASIDSARVMLRSAIDWTKTPSVASRYEIPQQSRERVKTPEAMHKSIEFGRVVWFQPSPSELYTVANTKWWATFIESQALKRLALLSYLTNDRGAARDQMQAAMQNDEIDLGLMKAGRPSNLSRLLDGIERGRFYATSEEIAQFPKTVLPGLLLSEWKFECEEWTDAIASYKRVREQTGLSLGCRAYIDYAIASAYIYSRNIDKGNEILSVFLSERGKLSKTPTYARAIFALASIQRKPEDALAILQAEIKGPIEINDRIDYLMRIGQTYISLGNNALAIASFNQASKLCPAGDPRVLAAVQFVDLCGKLPALDTAKP